MLFHTAIRKELARSLGATLIVLTTVVVTMTLIRTLGQATRGGLNPSDVMLVMGYTVLAYMPTVLSLSLFISIIATLTRMYQDSEMVIWFCAGRGVASLLAPLLRSAWPVLLIILLLALVVLPWTNKRIEEMRDQYEKRGDIERIEPGQFQESAGGQRVFFVEKNVGPDRLGNNIFIATQENGKETMTSARHGRIHMQGQQRVLSLSNGQRLERDVDKGDLKISEFAHYSIQIDSDALSEDAPGAVNTRSTLALLAKRSAVNLAELSWRVGLVLSALNFIVLAVALAKVNPRAGRSFNLLFSLLAFVVYENLLNLGHSWIAAGQLNAWVFTVGLHGGVLLLGLLWLAKEQHNLSWRNLFKMRAMFSRGAVS